MANVCLCTKFKKAVNNDNLDKLGVLTISQLSAVSSVQNQHRIRLKTNSEIVVSIVDGEQGCYIYEYASDLPENRKQTITISSSDDLKDVYLSNGVKKVEVTNKYSLVNIILAGNQSAPSLLRIANSDTEDYSYLVNLIKINIATLDVGGSIGDFSNFVNQNLLSFNVAYNPSIRGNISVLSGATNATEISLSDTNVEGDLSSLSTLTACTQLYMNHLSNISGNINSLGSLTNLNYLHLAEDTGVTGTIEGLVVALRTAGKTTGSIEEVNITDTLVTFNSGSVRGSKKLTWTASTITFNGTTINA